jgi:hypothetical protein
MKLHGVDIGMVGSDGLPLMPPVAIETIPEMHIRADGLTRNQRRVLEECANPVYSYGFTIAEINEGLTDMSKGSLIRIFGRLKESGFIARRPAGNRTR